jgi:hypothetical protein
MLKTAINCTQNNYNSTKQASFIRFSFEFHLEVQYRKESVDERAYNENCMCLRLCNE